MAKIQQFHIISTLKLTAYMKKHILHKKPEEKINEPMIWENKTVSGY